MSDDLRNNMHNTLVQDTQVEGQTCCHSILRSRSAKNNTIKVNSPFNKHKTNAREKGIKITHCNSLNSINKNHSSPTLKLKLSMNIKDNVPLIKKIKTSETADSGHQVQSTKLKVNKKCLDFKNRVILEHNLKPEQIIFSEPEAQQLSLSPRKTEGNMSTQLNTPRQTRQISFNLFKSVNPSIIANVIEEKTLQNQQNSQSDEKKDEGINLTLRKSRKTIEKLYQLQAGRKMEVFESEMSEASQEDVYSIVESFVWN